MAPVYINILIPTGQYWEDFFPCLSIIFEWTFWSVTSQKLCEDVKWPMGDIITQSISRVRRRISVSTRRYLRSLIPPWQMPADPVRAVWWFMHWLLKVLVHFFLIPILSMVFYESVSNWRLDGAWNGVSSGVITLLVGLIVWAILYVLLIFANIVSSIVRFVNGLSQFQQKFSYPLSNSSPYSSDTGSKVVEGTISEIEEEPQKQK